jgi:hypothetical protein
LHVYRQTPCPLDAAIFDRLVESAKALEANIKEKEWEYDESAFQQRAREATGLFQQQQFRDAFRAQCRAMLVLMDAVHRYRGKNEDFQPLWDRPAS